MMMMNDDEHEDPSAEDTMVVAASLPVLFSYDRPVWK